jgi:Flp pilus assembly protein TadD
MNLKPVAMVVSGIVLILQWPMLNYERADGKLSEFYKQVAAAQFGNARESINEAIRLWPSNARYYTWRAYCTSQQTPSQCPRRSSGGTALSESDRQAAQEAIEDYRHSLGLNSRDAVAYHNLAWLEHLLADDAAAAKDWRESTEIDPDNAVFHLSY